MTSWVDDGEQSPVFEAGGCYSDNDYDFDFGAGWERYTLQSFLRCPSPVFTRASLYTLAILVEAVYFKTQINKIMTLFDCIKQKPRP
jgi:hypothetical protein